MSSKQLGSNPPECKCGSRTELIPCRVCHKPICTYCRLGTGSISDGFTCSLACDVAYAFPKMLSPPAPHFGFKNWWAHTLLYTAIGALIFSLYYWSFK